MFTMRDRSAPGSQRHAKPTAAQTLVAIGGLTAPLIFWLIMIGAGLLRPGYNAIRQYGSELEVGPLGWLQRGNFIVVGLLMIVLAYGLDRAIARVATRQLAPALIAIAGVALATEGVVTGGTIHGRAFKLFSYALIASFVLIAPRLRADARWRAYAPYSILAALLALLLWIAYLRGNLGIPLQSEIGLVQRLYLAVIFGWLEALALRAFVLLTRSSAHRGAP